MASQPLETIPEETVAPAPAATPAPTPTRVTTDPPKTKPATAKNPGRVASGKRLAERNRLAREAKKKASAEAASAQPSAKTTANTTQSGDPNTEASSISLMTVLGIGGLLVSIAGVYYQRESLRKSFKSKTTPAQPSPAQPSPRRRNYHWPCRWDWVDWPQNRQRRPDQRPQCKRYELRQVHSRHGWQHCPEEVS